MTERLQRLRPPFQDPHRQALHAALVGGRRGTGPQAFDLTAPDGSLVGPFGLMLQAPHLGEPLEELGAAVRFETSLTDRVREVAILTVAVATDSGFERWAARAGREAGRAERDRARRHPGGDVRRRRRRRPGRGDGRTASPAGSSSDAPSTTTTYAAGVARLGEQGVLELVVLVGYYAMLAQMMEVFGVEAPDAGELRAEPDRALRRCVRVRRGSGAVRRRRRAR